MASMAATIAQDVVDVITAADLSQTLTVTTESAPAGWAADHTVVRAYLAEYELQDMDYTRCTVIDATYDHRLLARKVRRETYGIDVVLQARPADFAAKDDLMTLAQEINQAIESGAMSESGAVWVGIERTPLFEDDRFDEANMFAASSRNLFRVIRQVT